MSEARWTAVGAGLLAGLAGGLLSGIWIAGGQRSVEAASPEGAQAGADLEPALEAIARLVEELRSLGEGSAMLRPSPALQPQRIPADGSSPDRADDELVRALRELAAALKRRPLASSAEAHSLVRPAAKVRDLPELPPTDDLKEVFRREHLFLTYQQMLDLYGVPGDILATRSGGTNWHYQTPEGATFQFVFHEGFVIATRSW